MNASDIICIICVIIYGVLILTGIASNIQNQKSNQQVIKEIHKSNDLFDSLLEEVQANEKLTETVQCKATAQDNFMWESIVILAKRIHNLEDNNYVK
ncbi:hypothetical protein PUW61_06835 [Lactobacillus crispatus]|uniref:hypothetical protein n=1 Tax=Lactobacillus crispatus TaxID=47770 RepID=UPI0023A9F722|nr:hypothetical protein [Lactobacillus crispatus]WEB23395.1 hypothetical protein PUW61_06835 [Lactobacillus crispatus]